MDAFLLRLFPFQVKSQLDLHGIKGSLKGENMSRMIANPEAYFRQFVAERDSLLLELEEEARKEEIPIIGPVVGELLHILVRATHAQKVLELGTATGYSAIYLARACEVSNGRVVTLETSREMAARARSNFQKAGLAHRIDIRVGDALDEMPALTGPFDFIFMDIDKEFYAPALPHCQRLLKTGGLLLIDNTGFKEADDFNRTIANHPDWKTVHLFSFLPLHSPEKDGLSMALRI